MQEHGTAVSLVCPTCSTTFTAKPSKVRKGRKFCSRKCSCVRAAKPGSYRHVIVDGRLEKKHRQVMEQVLGRPLLSTEIVHHIDGNPSNNDPSNLEICASPREHKRKHSSNFITDTERECLDCHIIKPNDQFRLQNKYNNGRLYPNCYCTPCENIRRRARYHNQKPVLPATHTCLECSVEFPPKTAKSKFCSRSCENRFYTKRRTAATSR